MKRLLCAGLGAALLMAALVLTPAARADESEAPAFFPTPQLLEWDSNKVVQFNGYYIEAGKDVPSSTIREYSKQFDEWVTNHETEGITITLERLPIDECRAILPNDVRNDTPLMDPALQVYQLEIPGYSINVKACGEDGFFYALQTLKNLVEKSGGEGSEVRETTITDYPMFAVRGIFEGAYGVWDEEGRLEVLDWMGSVKLNTFLYGPKGDAKIRRRWRAPLSDVELFQFKRLMDRAAKNHIQVTYVLAPTLGFEYGSDDDFAVLLARARQLQGLGVRSFVIAFDDSMGMVYSPRDREKFANLGEAEVFVSNRLFKALREYDPEAALVLVPEIYAGVHEMDYTRALADGLDPEIGIGWTGDEIGAPKMDAASMQRFIDFYKRPPGLGDNWGSLYPMVARDADIYKYTSQFTSNPYNLFGELPVPGLGGASEPPLAQIQCASVAEFAWNPQVHTPEEVLRKLMKIYYDEGADQLFAMMMYKAYYDFAAYYTLDTDYKTDLEQYIVGLGNTDDPYAWLLDGIPSGLIEELINNPSLLEEGAKDKRVGALFEKRAEAWKPYFEKLRDAMNKIIEVRDSGDRESTDAAVADALKILKEEDEKL